MIVLTARSLAAAFAAPLRCFSRDASAPLDGTSKLKPLPPMSPSPIATQPSRPNPHRPHNSSLLLISTNHFPTTTLPSTTTLLSGPRPRYPLLLISSCWGSGVGARTGHQRPSLSQISADFTSEARSAPESMTV